MNERTVGVIGATSIVGHYALNQLAEACYHVTAFSRAIQATHTDKYGTTWLSLEGNLEVGAIAEWLCFCPITVLPDHFEMLKRAGARRVVALSSTSRFTKAAGAAGFTPDEINLSEQLEISEARFGAWAESLGIQWVILRPTLIYDLVRDKNLSLVARFIERFGFFPIVGEAMGLRQPVHASDVAKAAIAALSAPAAANQDYNVSGGEVLTYRDMVVGISNYVGRKPFLLKIPLVLFRLAVFFVRALPRYSHLSGAMAERMNSDLVFNYHKAAADFNYSPAKFLAQDIDIYSGQPRNAD